MCQDSEQFQCVTNIANSLVFVFIQCHISVSSSFIWKKDFNSTPKIVTICYIFSIYIFLLKSFRFTPNTNANIYLFSISYLSCSSFIFKIFMAKHRSLHDWLLSKFRSSLQLYQERDSGTGVFLWILRNFLEHLLL